MLQLSSLFNLFTNLITIGLITLNVYLYYQWRDRGYSYNSIYFFLSILSFLVNLLGWLIMPFILSNSRGKDILPEEERVKSETVDLFVENFGNQQSKTTLIFTNGWTTTAQTWGYYREALSSQFKLVFWDEPGLGKSKQPKSGDYSLSKYVNDLKSIIEKEDVNQKVVLVGHSIGGMLIQQLYKDHLDFATKRVSAIALLNTSYTNPLKTALGGSFLVKLQNILIKPLSYFQIFTWPYWQLNNALSYLNGMVHLACFLTGYTGTQTAKELDLTARMMVKARIDTVANGNLEMLKLDTDQTLKQISVPTLVMAGKNDIMTRFHASEHMANNIPNSKLVIVDRAGHLGNLEQANIYIKEIEELTTKI